METKEFLYKGKKMVYRTKGSGPQVVLLHGFGEDGSVWKNQFDLFPDHQLLVPDLPGSGGSEAIDDMSMEGLADAVYALIAPPPPKGGFPVAQPLPVDDSANEVESSQSEPRSDASANPPLGGGGALIGHSMGGYVTLAFAERHPKALTAFGLFHSTAFADSEAKKETRRKGIEKMKAEGAEAFLNTFVPNLYAPQTVAGRPALIEEHLAAVKGMSAEALVAYFEAMMRRPDRTRVLRETPLPVLFVMGRHDTAVPVEDGLKQCHLPQNAYIHLLQKSGHMGMTEEAEETNNILINFIKMVGF